MDGIGSVCRAAEGEGAVLHHRGDDLAAEVVGEVAPVGRFQEHEVGEEARLEPADVGHAAEDMGGIDGSLYGVPAVGRPDLPRVR